MEAMHSFKFIRTWS